MKLYVASSWRNIAQPAIVHVLRAIGHEVYDFRNPRAGEHGFGWSQISKMWTLWTPDEFREGLKHPIAQSGFNSDFDAMKWADAGILVMPCGRSAHLEAGYFVGAGKPLAILMLDKSEPELMYLMASTICLNLEELFDFVDGLEPKSEAA